MQQGRAQIDADFNEQVDISEHLLASLGQDVIGASGASASSFQVVLASARELRILPGRMYVDGKLCVLDADLLYTQQRDLPSAPVPSGDPLDTSRVPYLVYLDVWERHVSSLEDAALREVALQGADTCTRTQLVTQVKLLRLSSDPSSAAASAWDSQPEWRALTSSSPGKLTISLDAAGYQGHENQLYRLEIHDVQGADFYYKWSRDNGAICARVTLTADRQVTLDALPRDEYSTFASGQRVELLDEATELSGLPGLIALLTRSENQDLQFEIEATPRAPSFQLGQRLLMRRWDGFGKTAAGVPLRLERGINAQLSPGLLRPGDYWQAPARELSHDVTWPRDPARPLAPLALPPHGVRHSYARLAKVYLSQNQLVQVVDLRQLFISNTDIVAELNDIKRRLALLESKVP
jgi:hypothetical protein